MSPRHNPPKKCQDCGNVFTSSPAHKGPHGDKYYDNQCPSCGVVWKRDCHYCGKRLVSERFGVAEVGAPNCMSCYLRFGIPE